MRHDTLPRPAPPAAPAPTGAAQPSKHLTLLLLALTGLMLILDLTITNVALPSIQRALRMTPQGLQWVVNAYALGYGGFLLLGGRLADRLGRRRVFLAGVAVFTLASLVGGLAPSAGVLVAARGLQGLGAALAGPASLSIITTAFAEGPERNRALGVWSAVLASGGAIGMLAGGLLTQYASWRWVLFVNVPVGALLLAATPRVVPAAPGEPRARIDAAGAVTVTAGLAGLVYATTQVPEHGWATPGTVGFLLVAAVLSPRTGEGGGAWSAASSSCCLSSSACSRAERIVVARRSTIISSSTPRISAAGGMAATPRAAQLPDSACATLRMKLTPAAPASSAFGHQISHKRRCCLVVVNHKSAPVATTMKESTSNGMA